MTLRTRGVADGPVETSRSSVSGVSRPRSGFVQGIVASVMLVMTFALVYMYRVIDGLHHEQQAMRMELQNLGRKASLPKNAANDEAVAAGATDFLSSRDLQANALNKPDLAVTPEVESDHRRDDSVVDHGAHHGKRRLGSMFKVGSAYGDGCFKIPDTGGTQQFDVSTATGCGSGGGFPCPDCFILEDTNTQTSPIIQIQNCHAAKWTQSPGSTARTGVFVYTFINAKSDSTLVVQDEHQNSATPEGYYIVTARSFIQAYCYTGAANTAALRDRLLFPTTNVPELTVYRGLTLSNGNFDASGATGGTFKTNDGAVTINGDITIAGAKTFTTGTGAVTLSGDVTVADAKTFQVGATTALGGISTFYGHVVIGDTTTTKTRDLTLNGDFLQQDDASTPMSTFTTGTGAITLKGSVAQDAGKNYIQNSGGAGTFSTGTGAITLNGPVTQTSTNTFTTGTGAVTLSGDTTISASKKLTVGTAGSGGVSTLYGNVIVGGSAGSQDADLTLYGHFAQTASPSQAPTFTTGTGKITLNGDVSVATNKDLIMENTGNGVFQTGTGAITLNGDASISGSHKLTVGGESQFDDVLRVAQGKNINFGTAAGNTGVATFYGDVVLGSNVDTPTDLTVYGNFKQADRNPTGPASTARTFTTAAGQITLQGDVSVASGKDIKMVAAGSGQFITGVGNIALNGNVVVESTKSLTTAAEKIIVGTQPVTCGSTTSEGDSLYCHR
jgi:hypothetical protein